MDGIGPGRKKKYNAKSLMEAVSGYFDEISRLEQVTGEDGETLLNGLGQIVYIRRYIVPPTISALCLRLGIDRSTWQNYADKKQNPTMLPAVEYARLMIESYLEQELMTRKKGIQGVIFNLEHNYAWKHRTEIDMGERTEAAMKKPMTMEEKLNFLREMAEKANEAGGAGQGD